MAASSCQMGTEFLWRRFWICHQPGRHPEVHRPAVVEGGIFREAGCKGRRQEGSPLDGMKALKQLAKEFLPPVLYRAIGERIWVRWDGDHRSWEEAGRNCSGYDSQLIFEKVRSAMLKVKSGEAAFERDSRVFDKIHYSLPLLTALNHAARLSNNQLRILDFGGALGTGYFQNRGMLRGLELLEWNVVEQKHFVEEGARTFANEELRFFESTEAVFARGHVHFVLLSGSLQFLENPWAMLDGIVRNKPDFILIDRMPLLDKGRDRLTIQTVPKSLYEATYPCWLLNGEKLRRHFEKDYKEILHGLVDEKINIREATYQFKFFERTTLGLQPSKGVSSSD